RDLATERRDLIAECRGQGARFQERLRTGIVLDEELQSHEVVEFLHDLVRLHILHAREQLALRDPVTFAAGREDEDPLTEEIPYLPVLRSGHHRIHGLTDDTAKRFFDALTSRRAPQGGRRPRNIPPAPGGPLRP